MKKTEKSDPTQDGDLEITSSSDVLTLNAGDVTLKIDVSPDGNDLEVTVDGTTASITSA